MSARFPHITAPELATPRVVTFHGQPESTLSICWERGYPTRLVDPDLQSDTIEVQVTATHRQIKEAYREDDRRRDQYPRSDFAALVDDRPEWKRTYRDGKPFRWRTHIFFEPDTIEAVMREQGIVGSIMRLKPEHCFYVVMATVTRPVWRKAQYEWLRRMMITPPNPIPCKAEDLF